MTSRSPGISVRREPDCGCEAAADLISVDRALAIVADLARPVADCETLPLGAATGRVLAGAVHAAADAPGFDASAMDGYALRADGLRGDGPWMLPVGSRIAAGQTAGPLPHGQAARIFTGAPLPEGADTVVMQEAVTRRDDLIVIATRPAPGQNIRRRGQDMVRGIEVLPAGRQLGPRDIAAAAAAGAGHLSVRRRLRVTLLSNGAELAEPGETLDKGQIWNVNRAMLAAQMAGPGLDLTDGGIICDDHIAFTDALIAASRGADLVVTSGGASVGEEDHLPRALAEAGAEIHLRKVAMKPGKPLTIASIGRALVLGLPGNPVAAFVSWHVFGRPIVAGLSGAEHRPRRLMARLSEGLSRRPGRREFRPVRWVGTGLDGLPVLKPGPAEFSARVAELARADGLADIPAGIDSLAAGDLVEFLPFG
ncbi:molybdopterin molybdotransferase MoeA [Aurantimonas sp. A3-2-R12]|uniref:molybdopterin molybdotransferase MoeA n=1 Tax=Aurantimonas sp. A3-2-R12 TaxID=3114362 RepID=UPI002E191E98|nr:gephyrin-like molybdotransferase Glp [Aurantimonas sp. A3-2-R12]